jgi:hypothetical protein
MPTAADHESDDFNDKPRLRSVPHEPAPGPGEAELLGAESRSLGRSRAGMTARLERIREKLRQLRQQ